MPDSPSSSDGLGPSSAPARPTRERPYVRQVEVRYGETDQMGVVHHASYLLYLEDARTSLLREHSLPYREIERAGVGLPVRSVALQYRNPSLFEDTLSVSVWIDRTRAASVTFAYEIHRDEDDGSRTAILTAQVELACIDLETRRPRVFPESLKVFLAPA